MRNKPGFFKKSTAITVTALASAAFLSACSANQGSDAFDRPLNSEFSADPANVILIEPDAQEREKYQMLIARLTGIISSEKTTPEQRAQLLYQMGILYDRLGLDVTARNMFMNALIEVPDYAAVYNFIGSYLAAAGRFSEAYDAFDAVLELKPDETYAYFNRGIALYYGNRAKLAVEDLKTFYEFDRNDPFRMAWLYMAEREVLGAEEATRLLRERRLKADPKATDWGLEVLDFMAGDISESDLVNAVRYAEVPLAVQARRLCEAYFYMGKTAEFNGNLKLAFDYMQLCVATGVSGYLEYRYALSEIADFRRREISIEERHLAIEQQKEREELIRRQTEEVLRSLELDDKSSTREGDVLPPPGFRMDERLRNRAE